MSIINQTTKEIEMKTYDGDSPATCLVCRWTGEGYQLKDKNT